MGLTHMGQLKNINLILLTLTILLSCEGNQGNYIKRRVPVEIYESVIPSKGTINQDLNIYLKAYATNGCFSDLEIKLYEIDNRHFLFKATGLFETYGICPHNMVYKDTIISFIPASVGKYFFQTNESPFEIRKDTVEIN